MKKTLFLIISIIYASVSFAQQIAVSDGITVNLPSGYIKLTKDQALQHVSKKFKNNKIVINAVMGRPSDHIYKVNDILISLTTAATTEDKKVKDGHLAELKKGFDEMFKRDTTYVSTLKNVDGKQVVIFNYIVKNIGHCNFVCFNRNNSRAISGAIEFNMTDAGEAKEILNHIINSISFKE